MRTGVEWFLPVAALAVSVASAATCAAQDSEYEPLSATKRLFPGIGPGLRAVRHLSNGNYCVLAAPTPGLTVFNPQGKPLLQIGPPASEQGSSKTSSNAIVYGEDADVDSVGRIYVADRGTNAVKIFSPTGELLRSITVAAPISLVVSSGGEIAVTSLNSPHLVTVFDGSGKVWMALGNMLLRFDREGNRRATYKLYAPDGARLEATTILIEPDRMLIGGDPLGLYEFSRPDKKAQH